MLLKKFSSDWFSFGIWRKQTFRYWPIWASYLAIWILLTPNIHSGYYYEPENVIGNLDPNVFYFGRDVLQSLNSAGAIMAIYAGFTAMALYSYLYQSRSVNLFHAIPVRRETLFTTNFITGLSFMVIPNLIVTGYFFLLQIFSKATGDIVPILTWFAVTTCMAIFFFGLATLCAMGTAAILMMPVLYGIFNFLVVVVESVLRWLASMFLWGITNSTVRFAKWSPLVYMFNNGLKNNRGNCIEYMDGMMHIKSYIRFEDWGYMLVLALVGLLFAGLALLLYRRWQSESAGDLIAFSFLRPVFTYVWAAGCSLMLGSIFFVLLGEGSIFGYMFGYDGMEYGQMNIGGVITFVLCMLMGGTIGYFSANMLHRKSFRVFRKKDWLGYGAFVLGLLLVVLCIKVDLFDIEGWTPDLEDVESIYINGYVASDETEHGKSDMEVFLRVHETILNRKDTLLAQLEEPMDYKDSYVDTLRVRYVMKNGSIVERAYEVRVDKQLIKDPTMPIGMLYALMESPEKRMERMGLNTFGTLEDAKLYVWYTPKDPDVYEEVTFYVGKETPEKLKTLMAAVYQDVEEGGLGAGSMFDRLFYTDKYGGYTELNMWGEITLIGVEGLQRIDISIRETTPNLLNWLEEVMEEYRAKTPDEDPESKPSLDDILAGA